MNLETYYRVSSGLVQKATFSAKGDTKVTVSTLVKINEILVTVKDSF
jgi:hypothetical protein